MSCQNSHVRATNAPCKQSSDKGNYNTMLISVTIKCNNINKTSFPWVSPLIHWPYVTDGGHWGHKLSTIYRYSKGVLPIADKKVTKGGGKNRRVGKQ